MKGDAQGGPATFALPIAVPALFTYRVPPGLAPRAEPGMRALLPVGRGTRLGYMIRPGPAPGTPADGVRDVIRFVGRGPVFDPVLLEVLVDAARYYRHPPGLVLEAALPPGKAKGGAVRLAITGEGRTRLGSAGALAEIDRRVLELLAGGPKTFRQLARHVPLVTPPKIDEMREVGLVEERDPAEAVRGERLIVPVREPQEGERPAGKVGRRVLEALRGTRGLSVEAMRRSMNVSDATLRSLVKRGFVREERSPHRFALEPAEVDGPYSRAPETLTTGQRETLASLDNAIALGGFRPFLLHGVTGSGKTEVYIRAIRRVLDAGRSAVVLVPEIALTPQVVSMFQSRLGAEIAVLHSALTGSRRRAQWEAVRRGERRVVIGPRSAVFAPVQSPGIFVVDEEHDSSFKQGEGFRYSARDMALLRAQRQGAVALLGSATPSVESYWNAGNGRFELLTMPERATSQPLPEVEVVDLSSHRHGPGSQAYISQGLHDAMRETLDDGGQVILFINRRGFAPAATCTACGEPVRCPSCSVALVHHRFSDRLACHYCGYGMDVPEACPSCHSSEQELELRGPGTERIEQIVGDLFPRARILRMDSDVAAGSASEPILRAMREGEADVLVGTQMVTKGHDLPRVALVGVVRADLGLGLPDFRAAERTFQLLTQVAGRAGRGDRPGRVIVQTWNPDHPCIAAARRQNYGIFYAWEVKNRRAAGYPPFVHLALLRFSGTDETDLARAANEVGARLSEGPARVLGPVPSPLSRLRGRYRWQLLLKAETRPLLRESLARVPDAAWAKRRGIRVGVDVDPADFL